MVDGAKPRYKSVTHTSNNEVIVSEVFGTRIGSLKVLRNFGIEVSLDDGKTWIPGVEALRDWKIVNGELNTTGIRLRPAGVNDAVSIMVSVKE